MSRTTRARLVAAAGVAFCLAAVPATAQAASNQQDRTWIQAAHRSNLAEIAAGTDAQDNATDANVKRLGQMFVTMHRELDAGLAPLADKYDVELADAPTPAQQASLAAVKRNSGGAYDRAWVQAQTVGHLQAKAAGQRELASGQASDVLAADRTAAPVVQSHIDGLADAASDLGITVPTSVSGGSGGQAELGSGSGLGLGLTGLGAVLLAGAAVALRRRRAGAV